MANEKVTAAMETLVSILEKGDLETVTRAVFLSKTQKPCAKWSFNNQLIMLCSGTEDARGFRQWKQAGRYVKGGSKAFYILGPMTKKFKDDAGEDQFKVTGFKSIPVFRKEDTDGEPLEEDSFQLEIPSRFDGIISELGLQIGAVPFDGHCYGWYTPGAIKLATPEIKTFLHELTHAVDDKLHGLKGGQHADQELVAEFGAAVLGKLLGYEIPLGNTRAYIECYGTVKEIGGFFSRLEKIISFVLERTEA